MSLKISLPNSIFFREHHYNILAAPKRTLKRCATELYADKAKRQKTIHMTDQTQQTPSE